MLYLLGPRVIGLTGGIGSGKSSVSSFLQKKGVPVIDADLIAREVVQPGKPAFRDLVNHFGMDIVGEDGQLNRAKLGELAFSDPTGKQKEALNRCTHKYINNEISRQIFGYLGRGYRTVCLDAPLLFEAKVLAKYVALKSVVVYVTPEQQLERVVGRGVSSEGKTGGESEEKIREQAKQRIAAQMPLEEKCKIATYVLDNTGRKEDLERRVDEMWDAVSKGGDWQDMVFWALFVATLPFSAPAWLVMKIWASKQQLPAML